MFCLLYNAAYIEGNIKYAPINYVCLRTPKTSKNKVIKPEPMFDVGRIGIKLSATLLVLRCAFGLYLLFTEDRPFAKCFLLLRLVSIFAAKKIIWTGLIQRYTHQEPSK